MPLDRLRAHTARHLVTWGLIGAVAMLVGASWYQALVTPPYRFTDEQAHAGYVLEVQAGRPLPTIDTPIDAAHGGRALQERLAIEPARRHVVWVANDPPLPYLVAAVPAAATRALGVPGGPLLGLRLANVAAMAAAVVLAFGLARDLAGGDEVTGLVAAGLVAATPHLGFVAALGSTDGFAVLASTGVLAALARVCGAGRGAAEGRGRAEVRALGLWCAAAAAVRPMALVFAVVAALVGLAVALGKRRCTPVWALGWLVVPAAVTSGWWYILNIVRYGDPTASDALFDRFGRQPAGTLWGSLTLRGMWESILRTITTRRLEAPRPQDPHLWYVIALWVVVAGVVGAAVLVVGSTVRHRGATADAGSADAGSADAGSAPTWPWAELPGLAWGAVALVGLVPVVLTAQHRAGGGAPHPRYLLPMVPVVAAAVALTAVRLATRWTGLVLVVGAATVTWLQTRASARWLVEHPTGPAGSQLVAATGSVVLRSIGLAAAGAGLVALVAAIALDARSPVEPTDG